MKDRMSVSDQQVKFSLKCAACGELVEMGANHVCKKKEDVNESEREGSGASDRSS